MIKVLDGINFARMIGYGIRYLDKHRKTVNDLNVFPVPDGDTGTNMVMTMRNGYAAIENYEGNISEISASFAQAAVFGARGNSGVIVSQFFKGISEGLEDISVADCRMLSAALDKGCEYAYASVSTPTEGTILTVIKDASGELREKLDGLEFIDDALDVFIKRAKISLENTPNLLPILKKAGVVDSGGCGIIYFFEGMNMYLCGEKIENSEDPVSAEQIIDFSKFNKNSSFEFGYCTELLLQLTMATEKFNHESFRAGLCEVASSVVTSLEGDKVKVHAHSKLPEQIMAYCHKYGEFLTLKIENMSVQHSVSMQKFLAAEHEGNSSFAIVAVASSPAMQKKLSEMGADVVIMSEEVPSSQDFIDAFGYVKAKDILVFPNSSNSILSSMQAASLYKGAKVTVLNCRSAVCCYAVLSVMDFELGLSDAVEQANDVITNLCEVQLFRANRDIKYGSKTVVKNGYFSLSSNHILCVSESLCDVAAATVNKVMSKREYDVITLFCGKDVSEEQVSEITEKIEKFQYDSEVFAVYTQDPIYNLTIAFE